MIKLSREGLVLWSRVLPILIVVSTIFIFTVLLSMNFWPGYVIVAIILIGQIAIGKAYLLPYLKDLYISRDHQTILFKDLNGAETEFRTSQIVNLKNIRKSVYCLEMLPANAVIKWYFAINSTEDLALISPPNTAE